MAKAKIKAKLKRPSKAVLKKLYVKEGNSIMNIAKRLKSNQYLVRRGIIDAGLPLRKGPKEKNWDKYVELTIVLQSQDGGNSWGIKELIHDWNWRKPPGFVEALFFPMKTSKPHFKKDWKKGLDELEDRHKRYREEEKKKK